MAQELYELPEGWVWKKVEDVSSLVSGQHLKKGDYTEQPITGSIPYLTGPAEFGIENPEPSRWTNIKRAIAHQGDVLITVKGSGVGKTNFVDVAEMSISRQLMAVRATDAINRKYLRIFLKSATQTFSDMKAGAAIPGISRSHVLTLPVPIPPLAEQERIVAKLDALFTRLDQAITRLENTKTQAQALFESSLKKILRGCPSALEYKFDDICSIKSKLVDPREDKFQKLLHVGGANIESQTGNLFELKTAAEEKLISGKHLFDESTVLYSKIRPYLRKVARPDFEGLCSADIYPLTPDAKVVEKDYLFYVLISEEFTEYAVRGSSRAGMPKVNRKHLFSYSVALPSLKEQRQAVARLDNLGLKMSIFDEFVDSQLTRLSALKSSLLDAAFKGKL